jgi:glycosyltransferase involved in cell wall biosynthesis
VADQQTLSVIIPFYNRANYLGDAVASVFFQTVGNIQLILVDDGSTDGSMGAGAAIWDELASGRAGSGGSAAGRAAPRGSRELVRLSLSHGGTPGRARNRGAEAADGELIAFLDSDDIWLPEKLARQLPLHRGPDAVHLSHTRERWLRAGEVALPDGGPPPMREVSQKRQTHRRRGDLFADSLWKCIIGPSTAMMDRRLFLELGGFREDLEVAEDYEFWIRVTAGREAGYIDVPCVEKRARMPGQDQLSERYGQIEVFRIDALWGLLSGEPGRWFDPEQQGLAWQVLARKAEIYRAGAKKRGNRDGLEFIRPIIESCDTILLNGKSKHD